jgi:hypothetical protein
MSHTFRILSATAWNVKNAVQVDQDGCAYALIRSSPVWHASLRVAAVVYGLGLCKMGGPLSLRASMGMHAQPNLVCRAVPGRQAAARVGGPG